MEISCKKRDKKTLVFKGKENSEKVQVINEARRNMEGKKSQKI